MALPQPAPNSVAVVTGASSGIGAEIAKELGRRGHGVCLLARRTERLRDLAGEIEKVGVRAEVLAIDLSDRSARAQLTTQIAQLDLVPDILINNAGLSTLGRVYESDPESEMQMIEVDVVAVADLCSRFLPGMVGRGRGAIMNVASTAAFQPLPGQAGYGACKAFILSYSHSLVGELKGTGVSVTALCPGPVDTGFGEAAGFTKDEATEALPKFMWKGAADVAHAGVEGMAAGRTVVIPGFANQIGATFGYLAPRRLLVPMLAARHPGVRPR